MPIYAYKCASCGHAQDVLQKISDAPLTDCPRCGASTFNKQVTAAGFQLKGTGWYVTDFRGGSGGASSPAASDKPDQAKDSAAKPESKAEPKNASASGGAAPAASASPASSGGSSSN